ncbi:MAG: hypothetical protein JXA11_15625 [Phycisphaerae bacterium]|nr:hypothetical protein [Phycisphaerae bacterium]
MLASDDLTTRQAVKVILRKYDQPVTLVSSAEEILHASQEESTPQTIILDARLAGDDPIALLNHIFQTYESHKTHVFLLTHHQNSANPPRQIPRGAASVTFGGLEDLENRFQSRSLPNRFGNTTDLRDVRMGSEEEFMAVFLHAPIPIYLIDTEGHVLRANRAKNPYIDADGTSSRDLGYVLGCRHGEGQGRCGTVPQCKRCPLHMVIRETIREDRCFHRKEISLDVPVETDPSEKIYALASTTPLWIDRKKMVLLFLEDISELRRSQELLAEFNRNLESLVARRTEEVRALLEQKKEFIRQLGHDLRTPLTPLVALLPKFRASLVDPKEREMLELIINNTEYINQLVAKTLDLMFLENQAGVPERQTIDLRVEINNILADFAPVLQDRNILAVNAVETPVRLCVDVLQFKEMLLNLLSNAVKFSPEHGQVTISAATNEREVTVSVSDTGMGMTPEQFSRVFDEFYKVDPSRHDRSSIGLGLSICKRIVENHEGRIWIESPGLGKGTTVYIALPARRPAEVGGREEQ